MALIFSYLKGVSCDKEVCTFLCVKVDLKGSGSCDVIMLLFMTSLEKNRDIGVKSLT